MKRDVLVVLLMAIMAIIFVTSPCLAQSNAGEPVLGQPAATNAGEQAPSALTMRMEPMVPSAAGSEPTAPTGTNLIPEEFLNKNTSAYQAAQMYTVTKQKLAAVEHKALRARRSGNMSSYYALQGQANQLRKRLENIEARLIFIESNPLGGEVGQRNMWTLLHDAGVKSESYYEKHGEKHGKILNGGNKIMYPAVPVVSGGIGPLETVLIVLAIGAVIGIAALAINAGGNRCAANVGQLARLSTALNSLARRRQDSEEMTVTGSIDGFSVSVRPVNTHPAPVAQAQAPNLPIGQAYALVNIPPITLVPQHGQGGNP